MVIAEIRKVLLELVIPELKELSCKLDAFHLNIQVSTERICSEIAEARVELAAARADLHQLRLEMKAELEEMRDRIRDGEAKSSMPYRIQ